MATLIGKASDTFLKEVNNIKSISPERYKEITEAYDNIMEEFLTIQELVGRLNEDITTIYNIVYDYDIRVRKKGCELGYCLSDIIKLIGDERYGKGKKINRKV